MYWKARSSFSGVSVASFSHSRVQTTASSAVSVGKVDSRCPAPWAWSGSLSRAIVAGARQVNFLRQGSIVEIARQDKTRSEVKGGVKSKFDLNSSAGIR